MGRNAAPIFTDTGTEEGDRKRRRGRITAETDETRADAGMEPYPLDRWRLVARKQLGRWKLDGRKWLVSRRMDGLGNRGIRHG